MSTQQSASHEVSNGCLQNEPIQFPSIQELASRIRSFAVCQLRVDGSEFWSFDSDDETIINICRSAHGDSNPDDYIYEAIIDSLDAIESGGSISQEWEDCKAINWLASRSDRRERLNEYIRDNGIDHKNFNIASISLIVFNEEKQEVFDSVYSSLEELISDCIEE